ncbi:hypothetical protein KGR20_17475 [Cytobacillus oceanisediminis]|uniref:hypothetical protein n=1 Tax=Cytobacillus oceanisediminis TaxID=665099 RepID=UPI001CC9033D|nr:hypothetical protein [Cytobacillus oceanisediminis]MBZ9535976.1 hypothetical protein [Cytobacillus oceanisediminis]
MCGRVLRLDFKLDECLEWDKSGDLRVVVGFYSGISAKIPIYQPILLGYQPKFRYISQSSLDISQSFDISAKAAWISAKIPIYQPTQLGYQPKFRYISQHNLDISQNFDISANTTWISAKISIYQPTQLGYQTKPHHYIHKKDHPTLGSLF